MSTASLPRAAAASVPGIAQSVTLLCANALTIMAATAISPALPAIEAHFADHADAALLTRLLVTVPALVIACLAPAAGAFADRFGRRPLLVASVLVYAIAGLAGLLLDGLESLLVSRAFLGAGVAGILTASTALVGDLYVGQRRDRFIARQTAFTGVGGLVFVMAGGTLAQIGWRASFAIYAVAVVVLVAVLVYLKEPVRCTEARGGEYAGPVSWPALCLLLLAAVFNSLIFYLVPTQLPFLLNSLGIQAAGVIGLTLGAFNLTFAISSLAYMHLRRAVGDIGCFGVGFAVMACGFGAISCAGSAYGVLTGQLVAGLGMGAVMPSLMSNAMGLAPTALRGRIAGGLTAGIFIGQFLSPFVSQVWIRHFGYAVTFAHGALLLALVGVIACLMTVLTRGGDSRGTSGD